MRRLINDLAGGLLALALAFAPGAAAAQPSSTPFQNYIAPTPPGGDASDRIATTAFVQGASSGGSLALNAGQIIVGNALNIAAPVTPSGDCTISIPGVITCTQSAGNFTVNGALTVTGSETVLGALTANSLRTKSLTINGISQPSFVSGLPGLPGGVVYTTPFGLAAQPGTPFPNSVLISGFAGGTPTWSTVLPSGLSAPNFSIVSGGVQAIFGSNGIGTFATAFYSPILAGGSTSTSNLLIASNTCATATALNCAGANVSGSSGSAGTTDMVQIGTGGGGIRATFLSNGNVGYGTEINPKAAFVFSANTTGTPGFTGNSSGSELGKFLAADSQNAFVGFYAFGAGNFGSFLFHQSGGTGGTPTQTLTGYTIGTIGFTGYDTTNTFGNGAKARVVGVASDNYTSTTQGTYLEFDTTAAGGTTRAQAARFMAGAIVGVGTVDPGAGNLVMGTASTSPLNTAGYANLTLNQTTGGNIAFQAASTTQWQVFNTSTQFVIEDVVDTQNMVAFTAGAVGAGFVTFPNTLDATNSTTASHVLSGGLAVAKKAYVGTDLHVLGDLYFGGQTFAGLPGSPTTGTVAYVTDGLAANCGDSSCTTWGTNVTGGTGALKLLVWYNGSHWTLAGK